MNCPITLTVASYNICHGRYAAFDWKRIAEPIRTCAPDIVGIQEVDMFTRRVGNIDSMHALAEAAGLPHTLFVPTMDYDSGQYGTAILSRYPIETTAIFALPAEGLEPRSVGAIRVLPVTGRELWFVNTHLSYKSAEVRREQLAVLGETMREFVPNGTPALITGDFNTEEPIAPVLGRDLADINGTLAYRTFQDPPAAIDRILYTHGSLSPLAHGMVESNASDHNLLWAKFSLS